MKQLLQEDLHYVVSRIPKDVCDAIKARPTMMVGGGFIRDLISGDLHRDIDLFGESTGTLKSTATDLSVARGGKLHFTQNAITLLSPPRQPIQFITRWVFTDPETCISSFDFTVCQAVVYWK